MTKRVPLLVFLAPSSGVAVSSVCWKGEASEDGGESELAERRPGETFQASTNTAWPRESGKGCNAYC